MFVHTDATLAGLASAGATTALVSNYHPVETAGFGPYAVSLLGPILVLIAHRVLAFKAAKVRIEAERLRLEAEIKLNDGDPRTDPEGKRLLLEARKLEAGADALEGIKIRVQIPPAPPERK